MHDLTHDYYQPGPCPALQTLGPNNAGRLVTKLELGLVLQAMDQEALCWQANREFLEGR